MILRTLVDDGRSLLLRRRAGALELVLGNVVLLSSAALETERAFGRLAGGPVAASAGRARVVVGGLGFGATLRGVLDVADDATQVLVVEKIAAVMDVARNEARELVGDALDDPRVTLLRADVADVLAAEHDVAAILLDVDNGPAWASFRTNARLYADAALQRARNALAPAGIFAVWSGYPCDTFLARLRRAGFVPSVTLLEERGVVRARAYVGRRAGA